MCEQCNSAWMKPSEELMVELQRLISNSGCIFFLLDAGIRSLQPYGRMPEGRTSCGLKMLWVPAILWSFTCTAMQEQGETQNSSDFLWVVPPCLVTASTHDLKTAQCFSFRMKPLLFIKPENRLIALSEIGDTVVILYLVSARSQEAVTCSRSSREQYLLSL